MSADALGALGDMLGDPEPPKKQPEPKPGHIVDVNNSYNTICLNCDINISCTLLIQCNFRAGEESEIREGCASRRARGHPPTRLQILRGRT